MKTLRHSEEIATIFRSRLANRFARYAMGLSLLVTVLISVLFSYRNYQDNLNELHKELTQVENSVKNSLALHLWQLNMGALNLMLDDLLIDKDIVHVELLDNKGHLLIQKGTQPSAEGTITKSLPLYYDPKRRDTHHTYLGQLNYTATTAEPVKESKEAAITAALAIFILFVILGLLMLYIYWGSTVRHLVTIKAYANKVRLGGYRQEIGDLSLDRPLSSPGQKDELDELVDSINEMHHEVIAQYTAVEYQSLHDELTALPNRRMINTLISDTILYCRTARGHAVLYSIDLDHFRLLNESIGHFFGDEVLRETARRLASICREGFHLARISGDEFVILQNTLAPSREEARQHAQDFAERILSAVAEEMTIEGHSLKTTACIGIAVFDSASGLDAVVKQADNALHHAKNRGSGNIAFFEPAMQAQIDIRLHLEQLISKIIKKDLLSIHYQPKYDGGRNICSAEALVRMHDEEDAIISPGEFIPLLEQSGAIVEIGDHIIEKIFAFIQRHKKNLKRSGLTSIAINLSPTQYTSAGFAERIIALADRYAIDPRFIIFEITEEVVAGAIDNIIDIMHRLSKQGFAFSIDDFGTGCSSLRYLKNLPIGELKIDKSFVDDIVTDPKACAIVKTIIDMAHNFELNVVAEGIEYEEQFEILADYHCNHYQGYLFSRPLTEKDFMSLLLDTDTSSTA